MSLKYMNIIHTYTLHLYFIILSNWHGKYSFDNKYQKEKTTDKLRLSPRLLYVIFSAIYCIRYLARVLWWIYSINWCQTWSGWQSMRCDRLSADKIYKRILTYKLNLAKNNRIFSLFSNIDEMRYLGLYKVMQCHFTTCFHYSRLFLMKKHVKPGT